MTVRIEDLASLSQGVQCVAKHEMPSRTMSRAGGTMKEVLVIHFGQLALHLTQAGNSCLDPSAPEASYENPFPCLTPR